MAIEAVTNIDDLNPAFPTGSESKADGDDHIRNIKKAIKNGFAGYLGAVLVTGADGGAANAYTLTPANALPAYSSRMLAVFVPTANNTGAATLNISGLGAKPIISVAGIPLVAGDLTAGRFYSAFYDGTSFRLDNVTQNYVDQLIVSGTVPGVNEPVNAGKVFGSTGSVGQWVNLDGRGDPTFDNGSIATGTAVFDYAKGEGQKATATGPHAITATGFPANRLSGMLVQLTNYGAYAITSTGITWIKADGTETTNFATSGITLPAAGRGRVVLFSYGDGTVYGKQA